MILVSETGGISESGFGAVIAANVAVSALDAVTLDQQNDVTTGALAARITGAGQGFSFTDVNDLTIGTVAGPIIGITTNNGPIAVTTTAGPLIVNQNVSAGAATIELTAGGGESTFVNNAVISNTTGNVVRIEANRMALNGVPGTSAINAGGSGRVELHATLSNRPINLGPGDDPISVLSLSDAELDTITTTGVLEIGDGNDGDVSVSSPVGPNNAATLTIDTAGSITGPGNITVNNLRLSAGAAVSLTGNSVGTLAGDVDNFGAAFTFQDSGTLIVGLVDTVAGVTTNGGPIVISTSTTALTVSSPISAGSANITLTAGSNTTVNPADVLTISAAVTATGDGAIVLAGNSLAVSAAVSAAGSGSITANLLGANATAAFNNGAQVSALNGDIIVNAVAATTLNGAATLSVTGIGNITITTDAVTVGAAATISADDGAANANNVVAIRNFTAGRAISLGSDANLGLTEAELDRIRAETLIVGRNDSVAAGAITLGGQVDLTAGANSVPTLHLRTGAGVVDGTAGEQIDLRAAALAIEAAAGIGSTDDLDLAVSTLAAINAGGFTTAGNIQLSNTGALTVATVDGVAGVQRTGGSLGDVSVAASLLLTITAPVVNTTGGDVTLTADAPNSGNPAAVLTLAAAVIASVGTGDVVLNGNTLVQNATVFAAGNITANFGGSGGTAILNNGATLTVQNGLIDLTATNAIILNGGAVIATAAAGSVRFTTDDVTIAATALVSGSSVVTIRNFTAGRAINLGTNTALGLTDAELDRIGATTLILGRNDASAAGDITVSAAVDLSHGVNTVSLLRLLTGASVLQAGSGLLTVGALAVAAGGGIGTVATPLETAAAAFAASVGGGGVFLSNRDNLTIGNVGSVNGVTATGGAITISNIGAGLPAVITVGANVQTPDDITLTARRIDPGQVRRQPHGQRRGHDRLERRRRRAPGRRRLDPVGRRRRAGRGRRHAHRRFYRRRQRRRRQLPRQRDRFLRERPGQRRQRRFRHQPDQHRRQRAHRWPGRFRHVHRHAQGRDHLQRHRRSAGAAGHARRRPHRDHGRDDRADPRFHQHAQRTGGKLHLRQSPAG